ncbi:MAG: glycosyltransferase [Candidatus Hadarchaeum sp.]|uniref:glycosyltransferase n=1 Tax=Candidatus Hadarchaeum sp. TaxID=2883567 RepID=UPI00317EE90C
MSQPNSYSTKSYNFEVLAVIVNYDSKPFLAIERMLLKGLADLGRYTKIKLLLVDNYSTDGSFEELKEHSKRLGVDTEAVRLSKNYGFARAVNIAWHYAFKRWKFKYFMLLNNDLVIVPNNVAKLLKYLEIDNVAGVQGTLMQADNPRLIDNAGFAIDTFGLTYPICRGYTIKCAKTCHPSFLSGAFSVYRADTIEKLGQPFHNAVEAYFDDKYLGLRLWSTGYNLLHVPLVVAYHLGSASYAPQVKLKSPQWFEGVLLAELAPSYVTDIKARYLLIILWGMTSAFLSIIFLSNYVKNFIFAYRTVKILKKNKKEFIKNFSILPSITLSLLLLIARTKKGLKLQT